MLTVDAVQACEVRASGDFSRATGTVAMFLERSQSCRYDATANRNLKLQKYLGVRRQPTRKAWLCASQCEVLFGLTQ